MPVLWSYLICGYLRILSLSVATFVSVLIVSRFREIARFTALSGSFSKTALFTLYQVPFILPLALPISALIASFWLMQRLSKTGELTAIRAGGIPIRSLFAPLLITGALLGCFTFAVSAEIAPFCRKETKRLLFEKTSANPLLLLQRQNLVRMKNAYLHLEVEDDGKRAHNFLCISYNDSHERLSFLSAKELFLEQKKLIGHHVALISHLGSEGTSFFDRLVIENQKTMETSAPILSKAMRKKKPKLEPNALRFKDLQIRAAGDVKLGRSATVEKLRRIALSLTVLSFTFLGASFGMENRRVKKTGGVKGVFVIALLTLVSYFLAKGMRSDWPIIGAVLLAPQLLLYGACLMKIQKSLFGIKGICR